MEPIIEFEHVRKSYGEKTVLGDFSLAVAPGDFVTIVGASGGGKTTVLKMVNGLLTPDAGTIRVMGRDIRAMDLIQLRRNIGYAIQGSVLFPHMTVAENIAYVPNLLNKKDKARTKAAVAKWLAIVGLDEELLQRYPAELSGGQQQRVAIARALAMDPEVLFFDEPTSALDPELTRDVLKVIRDLAAERMTMVIVTHEMTFARDVADRIIFMDDGLVVEEGRAVDVINNPQQERTRAFLSQYQQG